MALNFPDSPTDGQKYTNPSTGETWTYEASTNSWTSDGLTTAVGIQYKGGIDITAAPPAGVANGWQYTVTTGGTVNAGFVGLSGNVPAGATIIYDGASWQQAGAALNAVTEVTATAPIQVANGTTTPALTIDDATTSAKGVMRLATDAEAAAGTLETVAVNPKQMAAVTIPQATRILAGKAEIATEGEITAGTDDTRFISPKGAKTTLMPYDISALTVLP